VTAIADDSGELQSFNDRVSLNNLGDVTFTAFDDAFTREALFTGRGKALTKVANTLGDYSAFGFRGPSLNDLGRVAFQAELDDFLSSGVSRVRTRWPTRSSGRVTGSAARRSSP